MPGLGLEQEEQVSVLLRLFVVGEEAFLKLGGIVEVVRDFVLLRAGSVQPRQLGTWVRGAYFFQSHAVLDEQCYPRIKIADVFLEHEVLLGL